MNEPRFKFTRENIESSAEIVRLENRIKQLEEENSFLKADFQTVLNAPGVLAHLRHDNTRKEFEIAERRIKE